MHQLVITRFGGDPGIRDHGLLDSALAQPQQGFSSQSAHAFPFGMAAAYAFHIAKNHPFVDGNKRVALMCAGCFLFLNGWELIAEGEAAADAIILLVEGRMDKAGLEGWLKQHSRRSRA